MPYTPTTYPGALDTPVNPVASDDTSLFDHAGLEDFQNNAIVALETKLGSTGSSDIASVDYKLSQITGGDKAVGKTAAQVLTNKTMDATLNTFSNIGQSSILAGYYLIAQAIKDALGGTSGTPSNSNQFVTENDTTNFASQTSNTISFVSSTHTIADSASGFVSSGFRPGDSIIVTGSASNNGTFTIVSVAAGAIVVAEALIDEVAGATDTIAAATIGKLPRLNNAGKIPNQALPGTLSYTAYDAQTAGNPIKWVYDSGVAKLAKIIGFGAYNVTISSYSGVFGTVADAIALTTTTALAIFYATPTSTSIANMYSVAFTLSGGVWTAGTPVLIDSVDRSTSARNDWGYSQLSTQNQDANDFRIYRVSDTAFVAGSLRILNGVSGYYGCGFYVGTVSGNVITLGSYGDAGNTAISGSDHSFYGFTEIDVDTAIIAYNNAGTAAVKLVSISESGRSISVLATQSLGWSGQTRIAKLSQNRFVAWRNVSSGNYIVFTVSGTTITVVNTTSGMPVTSFGGFSQIISINLDSKGIFATETSTGVSIYYFEESSGFLSFSPPLVKALTNAYLGNARLMKYDVEQGWYVLKYASSTSHTFYTKIKSTSLTVAPIEILTFDYQAGDNQSSGDTNAMFYDKQKLFVVGASVGAGTIASLDWDEFIGFAKTTVTAGTSTDFNKVGSIDPNQTALLPDIKYYISVSGTVIPVDSFTLNGLVYSTGINAGRAINASSIFVKQ